MSKYDRGGFLRPRLIRVPRIPGLSDFGPRSDVPVTNPAARADLSDAQRAHGRAVIRDACRRLREGAYPAGCSADEIDGPRPTPPVDPPVGAAQFRAPR